MVVTVISVATAHHGLIYRDDGLDIAALPDQSIFRVSMHHTLADELASIP